MVYFWGGIVWSPSFHVSHFLKKNNPLQFKWRHIWMLCLVWVYSGRSTCQVGGLVMWMLWVIGVSKPWEGPQYPMYSESSTWTRITCKCENKFCTSGFQAYSKNGNEESKFQWVVIMLRSMEKELNWPTRTLPRLTFNSQPRESGQEVQIISAEWKWMFFTLFQDFCIWKKSFYVIIFTVILSNVQ